MKKVCFALTILLLSIACSSPQESKCQDLCAKIDSLYKEQCYEEVLDSIGVLRKKYPEAIKERKKALIIWQEASLHIAQNEVIKTDSALQQMPQKIENATSLLQKNLLRAKQDSLKARYDAMCGVVRMIKKRMKN